MTTALRWVVVALLVGHGLIHLLGATKGLGWAAVPQLEEPIGVWAGLLWLAAAALILVAAVLIAVGAPSWWWAVAVCAGRIRAGPDQAWMPFTGKQSPAIIAGTCLDDGSSCPPSRSPRASVSPLGD